MGNKAKNRFSKAIRKKARRGFRGYPLGTVAYYGPDDRRASKVAVGIVLDDDGDPAELERWFSDLGDVREDVGIQQQVFTFLKQHAVKSVVVPNRIIGCPHEEGKDYPDGEACPRCPYWAYRDRWTGEIIQ